MSGVRCYAEQERRLAGEHTRYPSPVTSQNVFKISNAIGNGTTTGKTSRHPQQLRRFTSTGSRRHNSLPLRYFILNYGVSSTDYRTRIPRQTQTFPAQKRNRALAMTDFVGNREEPSLQWRS